MFTAGGVSVGSSSSLHLAVDSFPCRDCGQWTSWAFERSWFWLCPCSWPRATLPVTNLPCFHWILRHGEWRALMSQIAYAQDSELRTQTLAQVSIVLCRYTLLIIDGKIKNHNHSSILLRIYTLIAFLRKHPK